METARNGEPSDVRCGVPSFRRRLHADGGTEMVHVVGNSTGDSILSSIGVLGQAKADERAGKDIL